MLPQTKLNLLAKNYTTVLTLKQLITEFSTH